MSEPKHTPAPWATGYDGHGGMYITDGGGGQIGYVSLRPEQEANADLIRSAPYLLEACKAAYSLLGPQYAGPSLEVSRALANAIALAEGKGRSA